MTDIMNAIYEMFSYSFIVRGIIVGGLVALCASVLGVILVLKRYSMIGDGLSHVGFGSMAVGLAFNFAPLKIAIPIVIISAFFLLRISENAKLKGDSAIALFSSSSVAIGVIVNALSKGTNIDLNSYMFGSILAVSKEDMFICISMGIVVILSFIIFYHNIFSVTFDEDFTRATGVNVSLYKSLL